MEIVETCVKNVVSKIDTRRLNEKTIRRDNR